MLKLSKNQPHLAVTTFVFLCILLLGPMLAPLVSPAGQTYNIAVLFDVGGRGDLSFNDMAVYGAEQAKTALAAQGYTVAITYFTPRSTADFVPTLETFSSSGTYTLICCIGFLWTDALNATATRHPTQKYMIIDSVVSTPNVASVVFTEEQSSAMVGAAAAIATRTGKVAVVLGMEIPLLWKFEIGFAFGAKWMAQRLGKTIAISYYYTGTFGDPSKGQEAATTFLDQGADVIYAAAGATGLGVLQACSQRANATGNPIFSIGVDADQDYVYPGQVLCSARKKVDYGVQSTIEAAVKGTFASGVIVLGLEEGGVSMSTPDDMTVWADFLKGAGYTDAQIATIKSRVLTMYTTYLTSHQADLNELKSKIISGDIQVPVPTQGTIADLRKQYMGTFSTGIPLTWIIVGAVVVVVIAAGVYYFFMRRRGALEGPSLLEKVTDASKEGWVVFLALLFITSLVLTLSALSDTRLLGWVASPNGILAFICVVTLLIVLLVSVNYAVLDSSKRKPATK